MLARILAAIELSGGAVDLRTLARTLEVEPGALEGMIQHWVRKGRLVARTDDEEAAAGGAACPSSCVVRAACPAHGPRRQ